jgi:tRNA uridine 5-carboxymethylaminomethyl modification enzyme
VLVDDLVTRGTDEPYRLFTSRAEFRLVLRQDNALQRLGPLAAGRGLLTPAQREALERRLELAERLEEWLRGTNAAPAQVGALLERAGSQPLREPVRLAQLLKRPGVTAAALLEAVGGAPLSVDGDEEERAAGAEALVTVEMELKYDGYLARERERAEALRRQADFALPADLPYPKLASLSFEARQKLERVRPATLAQAGRIPGVSPSDLQNLVMEVRKRNHGTRVREYESTGVRGLEA